MVGDRSRLVVRGRCSRHQAQVLRDKIMRQKHLCMPQLQLHLDARGLSRHLRKDDLVKVQGQGDQDTVIDLVS
eukprot:SAG31_NODE_2114_length_6416_cov_25.024379_9_plen_73_part_00